MFKLRFTVLTLLLLAVPAAAGDGAMAWLGEGLQARADALDRAAAKPDWSPTVRDVTNCALARLASGAGPAGVEAMLRRILATQDMDPGSATYGAVPWQVNHPEIQDANAIEFAMQAIGPLLKHYGGRLDPGFRAELERHVRAAFPCLRRHQVPVSYTNIFLMKTVNLILLGEAVGDQGVAAEGYRQLDDWVAYTRQAGIHEFASPTYYSTDLGSLLMGCLYAARPGAQRTFPRILDYFWADIAANSFAPRQDLSGPHSRDYDFLGGDGGLLLNMALVGLRQELGPAKPDPEKVFLLENGLNHGYTPPAAILALARVPERVVTGRWDLEPGKTRTNYLTPDFAIGSASASYGPQDKLIAVELGSRKELPVISVVPDVFDAPYGKFKSRDRSGHSKPRHPPLRPAVAQEKGAVLALLDLDPRAEKEIETLATNVLLPARADLVTLDGKTVDAAQPFELAAGPQSVVGIREGHAAVAIRIFSAQGCGGQKPAFRLKADAEGLPWGALRYTVYHYRGPTRQQAEKHLRVGILILAGKDLGEVTERVRTARIETTPGGVLVRLGQGLVLDTGADRNPAAGLRVNGTEIKLEP
jgi:hypothetical protein